MNSIDYNDDSIDVLGEIRTVSFPSRLAHQTPLNQTGPHVRQMQRLSAEQAAEVNDTIYVSAMGTVSSIHSNDTSFVMHLTQYVSGAEKSHPVDIRAELAKNAKWQDPCERVPQVKAIVSIWGTLQHFETHVTSRNVHTKCIVVDVDDISYIFNPKKQPIEKVTTPVKKKGELQDRLKRRQVRQKTSLPTPSVDKY